MKRSKFSLSHYKLLSCDMGQLIPVALTEVLPGDTLQQATSLLVRVSPLLAPVMHPVHVRVHHWFVPHRLVWDNFEDFITGGPDGLDATVWPHFGSHIDDQVMDYYGIPNGMTVPYSALPARGYNLIFNEWYRDQDLVTERPISTGDGADLTTVRTIAQVAWEKDYFTSARPWTQKGPEVTIGFGATAPVIGAPGNAGPIFNTPTGPTATSRLGVESGERTIPWFDFPSSAGTTDGTISWNDPKLLADLSSATAVSINQLREAFAIQRYEEARARYGSRYTEYLRYLGVRSSDARLQRPEYLGGGKQTIQFSEVLQTSPVSGDGVVGDLKGHGIGAVRSNRYRRFFEEHGYIHTLISVKPKTIYMQSVPRTFYRQTKEDYFQRELQHIGQQEVYNKEVTGLATNPTEIFGYQDRYDEYRRAESSVAGEFRSTLNFWHYARDFGGLGVAPVLNSSFVTSTPTKRVNAVTSEDVLWIMANHSIQARRQVAKTGASFIF